MPKIIIYNIFEDEPIDEVEFDGEEWDETFLMWCSDNGHNSEHYEYDIDWGF